MNDEKSLLESRCWKDDASGQKNDILSAKEGVKLRVNNGGARRKGVTEGEQIHDAPSYH